MSKESAKILMADDSAFMRSVLKNILENNGYKNLGAQRMRAGHTAKDL